MGSRETVQSTQTVDYTDHLLSIESFHEGIDLEATRIIDSINQHIQRFISDPKHQVYERLADLPFSGSIQDIRSDQSVWNYLDNLPSVHRTTNPDMTEYYRQDNWWWPVKYGAARVTRTQLVVPDHAGIIYCLATSRPIDVRP